MNKQKMMQLDAMTLVIEDLKSTIEKMDDQEKDPQIKNRLYSIGWNLNKASLHLENLIRSNGNPPAED